MIDANGTRHHLVFGRQDWLAVVASEAATEGEAPNVRYDDGRAQLTLTPNPPAIPVLDTPAGARRAAAVDAEGDVYYVSPDKREILLQSAADGSKRTFWPDKRPGPRRVPGRFGPAPRSAAQTAGPLLGGLTVTTEDYLVVGTTEPIGLLVFDLRVAGSPLQIGWTASTQFNPVQLVATGDGGCLVLDSSPPPAYWRLDRALAVAPAGPAAAAGPAPGSFGPAGDQGGKGSADPGAPGPADAVPLAGSPNAIATIGDRVLILTAGPGGGGSTLTVFRAGEPEGASLPLGFGADGAPIVGHDMVVGPAAAGDPAIGQLYVASATRAQAFSFRLVERQGSLSAELTPDCLPLRQWGGRGLAPGPLYDHGDRWLPLAVLPPLSYAPAATIVTRPFDGRDSGCVWHRLMLDVVIPPRCSVTVSSRAADELGDLAGLPFAPEPRPAMRASGNEQPYVALPYGWSTYETLFQRAAGRYLQLELAIRGDGRRTPRLRALRAYYPRFSYLHSYLPGLYRSQPDSSSFLDRYLANVEGINTGIEDLIATAEALLDPRCAPAESLQWLAGFFDVALDPAWTEDRSRLFLGHAMEFFRRRGTIPGLQAALRLALDPIVDESVFSDPPDPRTLQYRIVELFASALPGAGGLAAAAQPEGPRLVSASLPWNPSMGLDGLLALYVEFRQGQGLAGAAPTAFPLAVPAGAADAAAWRVFAARALGFEPALVTSDAADWSQFLSRRYRRIDDLNRAYGVAAPYASFDDVPLPAAVPPDGPAQWDWYQFEALVQPAAGNAHRFAVLLPLSPGVTADPTAVDPTGELALARRLIELNKPAHTQFELRYYWAALQVGAARLGHDTALGVGSRAPQLRLPARLGSTYAGAAYLGGLRAPRLAPMPSIGRDQTLSETNRRSE